MAQANERGGVLSFVIIGILLAALVIGGIVAVKHYVKPTTNDVSKASPAPELPSAEPNTTSSSPAVDGAASSTVSAPSTNQPSSASIPATGVTISQTGPESSALGIVLAGLMTASATAYVRSRRHTATL